MKKTLTINSPVIDLPGVGAVRAANLEKMGIRTLRDLVKYTPRAYENRGNIRTLTEGTDGAKSAFLLTVGTAPRTVRLRGRLTITKFRAFDETGTVEVVFYNQTYLQTVFTVGATFRFWGSLNHGKSKVWTLSSPAYEPFYDGMILPDYVSLYPLTAGITRKVLEGLIDTALAVDFPDYMPEDIRLANHLPTLSHALRKIHHPDNNEDLAHAMRRLVFDELFCISAAIAAGRSTKSVPRVPAMADVDLTPLYALLPYQLTGAQQRSIAEIAKDMVATGTMQIPAMRRILIGDVGSGKTICAVAALYIAAKNGYQAALMAPTEILATQHYHDIGALLSKLGIGVSLLTGSTPLREKKKIYEALAAGAPEAQVIIGTHALLTDKVIFRNLLLTITDEQHRFGIEQRSTLDEKSAHGHLLVMSATPIPRTLALSLYGDLSISRLDEMPAGRQHIDTFVVDESYRERLNGFIAKQIEDGGQIYVVCPAIEEAVTDEEDGGPGEVLLNSLSPSARRTDLKSAKACAAKLKERFPQFSIGLLHGQMKAGEKEGIMNCFVGGDIDILVSTTVIEVGVNVPNASLMIVENAENFGLSQLHQLRGRVGRGTRKSYCILVSDFTGGTAKERLQIMARTNDGFEIAERDLMLRGPGDFFSGAQDSRMRQSGGMNLRLARCCDDPELMNAAFSAASALVRSDPTLEQHPELKHELSFYFRTTENEIS